ncbi:MAG: solute carrier family 23 protein [Collinsella sp.]
MRSSLIPRSALPSPSCSPWLPSRLSVTSPPPAWAPSTVCPPSASSPALSCPGLPLFGGLLGGLPTSALGQNVGIICSNKVVNKWVVVIIAAVFAIAGLVPQLSAVLSAIPQPVIGGATVGVFGTITMNGVRMFTREGLTQRTTTIVGPPSSLAGYLDGQRLPCRRGYARLGVHHHRLQCRNPHRHHGHCP